jgi:glycosyltransferase involved in cell wall biosynthesis
MSEVYKYIENKYAYKFTIVQAETDDFTSDDLNTVSIPSASWEPIASFLPFFPRKLAFRRHLAPIFDRSDAIVTIDPILYPQAVAAVRYGAQNDISVFCDISQTVSTAGPLWFLERKLLLKVFKQVDGFIATVPKCLERFRDIGLFSEAVADRTYIMGHPVDVDTFSPKCQSNDVNSGLTILVISRLVPEKGLAYIVQALAPLLRADPKLTLRFLGSGELKSYLKRRTKAENIRDSVEFLGTVPHEYVPSVINDCDVYINHAVNIANWEEFFGVANLEAMACETACVVSDGGGIPYVIRDPDVVESVEQRNVIELRQTVSRLLNEPEYRSDLGKRAREYVVENYAVDQIAEKYHQMLTERLD